VPTDARGSRDCFLVRHEYTNTGLFFCA
jgi:hypothetical protein